VSQKSPYDPIIGPPVSVRQGIQQRESKNAAEATMLVVDDHPDLRQIVASVLCHKDYRVHKTPSGGAAMEIISSTPVDGVIADLYFTR
jgi:PleD family two-component response regulator